MRERQSPLGGALALGIGYRVPRLDECEVLWWRAREMMDRGKPHKARAPSLGAGPRHRTAPCHCAIVGLGNAAHGGRRLAHGQHIKAPACGRWGQMRGKTVRRMGGLNRSLKEGQKALLHRCS